MGINLNNLVLIFLAALPLFISSSFFFLKDPPIWPDEPIFLDKAQNIWEAGHVVTFLHGMEETEKASFAYPPFYFLILDNWINVFGSSIEVIRALSFVFAILSLTTFFFIAKLIFNNSFLATLAAFFLAANVHFSRASHVGRVEMLVLFLILLSWLLFLLAQKRQKNYLYLAAALFAALAPAAHPMGIISPIILTTSLLFTSQKLKQKIHKLLIVTLPILFINLFWVLKTQPNILSFFGAFNNHFIAKSEKLPYMLVLFKSDFSWWMLLILYLIVFLFFIFSVLKSKDKLQIFTLIGLIMSIIITTIGKEGGYFLYIQPFIILSLMFLLNKFKKISVILLILVFLGFLNIQYFNNDNIGINSRGSRSVFASQNFDYHDFTKRIIDYLPKNGEFSIFIASTPDPYFDLKKTGRFKILEAVDPNFPIPDESYKKVLDSVDYLIISWVPHQFLAEYINKNTEEKTLITQPHGYSTLVIKLKPKNLRQ